MPSTPTTHAFLSASASHRWLNCTAAPIYEAGFKDDEGSPYAQEGTIAHQVSELYAQYNFNQITKRQLNNRITKIQKNHSTLYNDEMLKTAEFYAEYLHNKALEYTTKPHAVTEVRVDFSEYVPDGFGTCDCVIIGNNHLHITDYKHGKGVEVSAKDNSQMRLYALGALKMYAPVYLNIERVSMAIVQPRITEDVSEEELSVSELIKWGESIKPIAEKAYTGEGAEFKPGNWCKFCKGRQVCKARTENATAIEDFKNIPIEGELSDTERLVASNVLTDADVADLLKRGADLVAWYNDLQAYALNAIMDGKEITGYKVVAGRSNRVFTDTEAALTAIQDAGYDEALLYERKPKTLTELEKMVGKKDFTTICGKYINKPLGKPTLVTASDKREPYNAAANDFKGAS